MAVYMHKALVLSLEAAADLSAAQYKFVKLDTAGKVVLCAAVTDKPIGVLLNKPNASGKTAEVGNIGVYPVDSDSALNEGDLIGTAADGQADAKVPGTDTTNFIVGHVLVASGAAGELAVAAINCASPARAA